MSEPEIYQVCGDKLVSLEDYQSMRARAEQAEAKVARLADRLGQVRSQLNNGDPFEAENIAREALAELAAPAGESARPEKSEAEIDAEVAEGLVRLDRLGLMRAAPAEPIGGGATFVEAVMDKVAGYSFCRKGRKYCRREPCECRALIASIASPPPDPREAEIAALRMTVNSRDARITDLTQQRDYWRNAGEAEIAELRAALQLSKEVGDVLEVNPLRELLAKAATALEPFAKEAKAYAHCADDVCPLYVTEDGDEMHAEFTASDLRTAAAVLRKLQALGVRG